jgi:hypothetical protein
VNLEDKGTIKKGQKMMRELFKSCTPIIIEYHLKKVIRRKSNGEIDVNETKVR